MLHVRSVVNSISDFLSKIFLSSADIPYSIRKDLNNYKTVNRRKTLQENCGSVSLITFTMGIVGFIMALSLDS